MPFDIIFGSNHHIKSNGIIRVNGKVKDQELIKIETAMVRGSLKPLITIEIRDKKGELLGKAYRSTSFVYVHPDYEAIIETEEGTTERLALMKKDNGTVFDMKIDAPDKVEEASGFKVEINGEFYVQGIPIKATSDGLKLPGGGIISHCEFNSNNKDIVITIE